MKAFTRLLPIALLAACLPGHTTFAASFDCSKAGTLVETAICNTPTLSTKDEQLSELYLPLKHQKIYRELQRQWLRDVRNHCDSTACIESAYDQQIARLTPPPERPRVAAPPLTPTPGQEPYRRIEDAPWQRFALATIPEIKTNAYARVVDVTTVDGVLNVVIFVGEQADLTVSTPSSVYERRYFGSLYEYSDARPGLHPIARDIRFSGWGRTGANDQGERYAGIIDGVFYYRQRMRGEAEQSMAYTLGSRTVPQPSTQLYATESSSKRFSKAIIASDLNVDNTGLLLIYPFLQDDNVYDRVMSSDDKGWSLMNPIWSPTRPVLYFDNNGDFACVWRVDLENKTLEKIVPEHEAVAAFPADVLGHEAVVYLEANQLKFAIAPGP